MKHHGEGFIITESGVLQRCVQALGREGPAAEKVESRDGGNSKLGWGSSAKGPVPLRPGVICKLVDC